MIDQEEIIRWLASGEFETVEFKKSTGLLREGIEAICAFANKHGGYLLFGVDDNGVVIGQTVSDDTLKNLANAVKLNTEPKLFPTIDKIEIQGKSCILVTVEESPLKPHLAYGRPCIRVGATNQQLDRQQYDLLLQLRYNGYGFDHQVCPGASMADIDGEALLKFFESANAIREINENLLLPPEMLLQKLDVMKNGGITNAAILLFGKEPSRFFPNQFEIKCGGFLDDEGYGRMMNDQEYSGAILANFPSTLAFVARRAPKRRGSRPYPTP